MPCMRILARPKAQLTSYNNHNWNIKTGLGSDTRISNIKHLATKYFQTAFKS